MMQMHRQTLFYLTDGLASWRQKSYILYTGKEKVQSQICGKYILWLDGWMMKPNSRRFFMTFASSNKS